MAQTAARSAAADGSGADAEKVSKTAKTTAALLQKTATRIQKTAAAMAQTAKNNAARTVKADVFKLSAFPFRTFYIPKSL